jgi:hypothetical protein
MKRLILVLMMLVVLTFAATPAFAQGSRGGDQFCTSGAMVVHSEDTVDSVILFGCNGTIQTGAHVNKDVVSFGGNIAIEQGARIDGDVVVFGGNVKINGNVKRDVTIFGGNVVLESSAVVERDVVIIGGAVDQQEGATVKGRVTRGESGFRVPDVPTAPTAPKLPSVTPTVVGGGLVGGLAGAAWAVVRGILYALALAALGMLVVVFLPKQARQVIDVSQSSALPSLGVGCLSLFVAITLGVLLIITICGIPFGVVLFIALAVASAFGWIAVGWLIGEKIMGSVNVRESWKTPLTAVIVGVLLLAAVSAVPIVGWVVSTFFGLLGLGAVVLTRFGTRPYPMPATAIVSSVPAVVTPTVQTPVVSSESKPASDTGATDASSNSGTSNG